MKSEENSEELEAKKKARREKLLDPNRLKVLSESVSDFPEEQKTDEVQSENADDLNNSKVAEIFKTVAQSQDFQKRNILYWIRRVNLVVILFGFSVMICIIHSNPFFIGLNPDRFFLIDKLFIKLLIFSFFSSTLSVVVCSSAFRINFSFYEMIGSNWVAKLLVAILNLPQYVIIIIDFAITFYISLSILIFGITAITAYQTYIHNYITLFNVSIIISMVVGIISVVMIFLSKKEKENRIELIVEYLFYELTLIPVSQEVKRMLRNDKSSVTYKTDKRSVQYEELLERICILKQHFGDDINQFIQNNKAVIYNRLEKDERFKVFEKDVEKEGENGEKVGSYTMIWAKPIKPKKD